MKLNGFKHSYTIHILFITPQSSTTINYSECFTFLLWFWWNANKQISAAKLGEKETCVCVWGGSLCVSYVQHDDAKLVNFLSKLTVVVLIQKPRPGASSGPRQAGGQSCHTPFWYWSLLALPMLTPPPPVPPLLSAGLNVWCLILFSPAPQTITTLSKLDAWQRNNIKHQMCSVGGGGVGGGLILNCKSAFIFISAEILIKSEAERSVWQYLRLMSG